MLKGLKYIDGVIQDLLKITNSLHIIVKGAFLKLFTL